MRVPTGPATASTLAWQVDHRGPKRQQALRARLRTLLDVLTDPRADTAASPRGADVPTAVLLRELETVLAPGDPSSLWLALAVLDARLPQAPEVRAATRATRLDGPLTAMAHVLHSPLRELRRGGTRWPTVEVVTGEVVVDVHHTSQATFATGIQRVARQSAQRWARDHSPVFVGWTPAYAGLRRLVADEVQRALYGKELTTGLDHGADTVIPWRCTYVLPELLAEPPRAERLQAMLEFSQSRSGVIGFDCVPLTSAETTAPGMSGGFALNLGAVAHMDGVAAISEAAATEYRGWRSMLPGAGLQGPAIAPISLPVEGERPDADALERARAELLIPGHPMVLVVGSNEPRKNHLAVLHAAELLWREGRRFSLVFVGGHSWSGDRFVARLAELRASGRPVQAISALSDDLLWAAYALAYCTLFPSLNEGFGLPVAESLAAGTPVITSRYGSMREIAAYGGAVLVDPRDDHDIADALRRLLSSEELHARLSAEARRRPLRTWDEYAEQTWQYLVNGVETPAVSAGSVGSVGSAVFTAPVAAGGE